MLKVQKKKKLNWIFEILMILFLQLKIYLQMGLFLIFIYFTIILERSTTKLRHTQLGSWAKESVKN